MKTSDLIGPALDWAVAKCEGFAICLDSVSGDYNLMTQDDVFKLSKRSYSTDWPQGGPIIERENITLRTNACITGHWAAFIDFGSSNTNIKARQSGPTPLIAAMRCYVASKLGDEVEIPEELKCG